nr:putative late embryogenesis abundant protein, LEA-14 [Tanacetum cinerariifolium]
MSLCDSFSCLGPGERGKKGIMEWAIEDTKKGTKQRKDVMVSDMVELRITGDLSAKIKILGLTSPSV